MVYCMSDIHGEYEKYRQMLEQLRFSENDTLYVLGDVIDRGPGGVEVLRHMMEQANIVPLIGNHEYMALTCLRFLNREISEESISALSSDDLTALLEWQRNGAQPTIDGFAKLRAEDRAAVLDYLGEFQLYEEVQAGGQDYVLVHAGLTGFDPRRPLDDYELHEMIFECPYYGRVYYSDRYLVTGHLPTRAIPGNPNPDRIYRANRHIALDCGAGLGGVLGAICLDTGEEFYC